MHFSFSVKIEFPTHGTRDPELNRRRVGRLRGASKISDNHNIKCARARAFQLKRKYCRYVGREQTQQREQNHIGIVKRREHLQQAVMAYETSKNISVFISFIL